VKAIFGALVLFAVSFSLNANAASGLVYEQGGGFGYINQLEMFQIKVIANYLDDTNHSYNSLASFKLSAAHDISDIDGVKLYVGLGFWDFTQTSKFESYQTRIDGIVGVRHEINSHFQVEAFINLVSAASGQTINTYVDDSGTQHTVSGQSALSVARTGGIALDYFF
jgi:hypothetical protein